jgi:two-component system invasion response regulator UvrY
MDITLPGATGIEALRRILAHDAGARVLIFSMHEEAIFASHALQAGAFGYLTKASAPDALVQAVHSIAGGKKYVSADIAQKLALREFEARQSGELTEREFEVLQLLAQGRSLKDIAESMGLHPKTVANHQSAIKAKLGAESAIDLLKKTQQLVGLQAGNA